MITSLRAGTALLAAAVVASALAAGSLAAPAGAAPQHAPLADAGTTPNPLPPSPAGSIRITQANLLSGQNVGKFQADVSAVLTNAPDFITYNEVPERQDGVLAPAPYQIWRTPGQYTGEAPVAWNASKWTMVNEGTTLVSNKPGRVKGETVDWGIRYANWVTLQGVNGQTISIISAHVAPMNKITEGLVPPSIANLGTLANQLSASGPVLMAGDMNFSYTSASYPRDLLTQWGFTPTFDVLGSYLPTGDHYGNTIDYVFLHNATQFVVQDQYTTALNSDHDALTSDVAFTGAPAAAPVTFAPGTLTSSPTSGRTGKRAVLDLMVRAIDNAPKGAAIHLSTASLNDKHVVNALMDARDRGVHVQFVTLDQKPNDRERKLLATLGDRTKRKNWGTVCTTACRGVFERHHMPQSRLMVSLAGATSAIKIDADQPLTFAGSEQVTTATITTSLTTYDKAFRKFFRLVGRDI